MAEPGADRSSEPVGFSLLRHREAIFTLPNSLTLARIPLAAAVWIAPANAVYVIVVVAVAGLTDVFDGRVARALRRRRVERGENPGNLGEHDAIGAWLDPICDKLFVLSVVIALTVGFDPPIYAVLLIATREALLLPLAIARWSWRWFRDSVPIDFRAGTAGKATTACQFAALVSILFWPAGLIGLAIASAVLGVVAVVVYVRRGLMVARQVAHNPIGMAFANRQSDDSDDVPE